MGRKWKQMEDVKEMIECDEAIFAWFLCTF